MKWRDLKKYILTKKNSGDFCRLQTVQIGHDRTSNIYNGGTDFRCETTRWGNN